MHTIQIVVKKPLEAPEVITIENTLKAKQDIVGGWIEYLTFYDFDLYLNEEGKLSKLPSNLKFPQDIVVGTVYVTKANEEGNDVGLTDEEAQEVIQHLNQYAITDENEAKYFDDLIKERFS